VFLEQLIEAGRHVEVQIFADRYGRAIHLGERDCTVQRNHQKLIEESPSPAISRAQRAEACALAARAAARVGYVGAGTMELLFDGEVLRFMELNCRLQVEHTVTEERTGRDLVIAQIEVAAGRPLPWRQEDIERSLEEASAGRGGGHVIECRINAEDPARGFAPAPGAITAWRPPAGEGVRVDTHVEPGYVVPPFYDSLIAKVIVRGVDRGDAIGRMVQALSAFVVEGVPTTIPMHLAILQSPAFRGGAYDTRAIPGWPTGGAAEEAGSGAPSSSVTTAAR
jgi:acetyl-CoA carboxylase biotin carboxylase subunit